jgi:hypothetical protein
MRAQAEHRPEVTGDLLAQLREVAGVVNVSAADAEPENNPLGVLVELGNLGQLGEVRHISQRWVRGPLTPYERMERIVGVLTPSGNLIGWALVPEEDLPEVATFELRASDCEAAY